MPDKRIRLLKNPSSALIGLKPRQVLLAERQHPKPEPYTISLMAGKNQPSDASLESGNKTQLLHSVLRFLEDNHFSKSLKRLLKEAQIEGSSWKDRTLDLENLYYKCLESCIHVDVNSNNQKGQEQQSHEDYTAAEETDGKKKKKKKKNMNYDKENDSEIGKESKADKRITEPQEMLKEKMHKNTPETEAIKTVDGDVEATKSPKKQKEKEKKKKKKDKLETESINGDEITSDVNPGLPEGKPKTLLSGEAVKFKDKMKKNKLKHDHPSVEDTSVNSKIGTKEEKNKSKDKENISLEPSKNGADNHKDSKKRGRPASDENETQAVGELGVEDSKRRKTVVLEANGTHSVEYGEVNKSKSGQRQQRNGSAEPKTVNAFQRVKIDEVEFVDERLQDNSYWAKDGADRGYGAKAQEILGQVKGRDFRHEKTKKKRGSYRGGQIDLDSHSIKFNYSDDE